MAPSGRGSEGPLHLSFQLNVKEGGYCLGGKPNIFISIWSEWPVNAWPPVLTALTKTLFIGQRYWTCEVWRTKCTPPDKCSGPGNIKTVS